MRKTRTRSRKTRSKSAMSGTLQGFDSPAWLKLLNISVMYHLPRYYVQYRQSGAICTQWFHVLESAIKCAKNHENARVVDYFTYNEIKF